MDNVKSFIFYSLAFSTGLLIYTIVIYLFYLLFLTESNENEDDTTIKNSVSEEKIADLNDLECLEDV